MSSMDSHFEGNLSENIEALPTHKARRIGLIVIGLLIALFLIGFIPHFLRERQAKEDAEKLSNMAPNVEVVTPRKSPQASEYNLPADVTPFQTTQIFPRANGYLKSMTVDIGDKVTENQKLAEIDAPELDAELAQAQATQARAESSLKLAEVTTQRYEKFSNTGGISQQNIDERRAAAKEADAALLAAKADVQRLTELKQFTTILAPFPGVIAERNYDIGALLSPGQTKPIFRLERTDILRVFINVPQNVATGVQIGSDAQLVIRNYPDKEFTGKITRTAGSIDTASRTLRVEVDVPNQEGLLFGGMYGAVKLSINPRPFFLIPTSSVIFDSQGTRIATVVDSRVHYIKVSVGNDFGSEVEILNGLNGDEKVVTNPGQRIAEGREVNIVTKDDAEEKKP